MPVRSLTLTDFRNHAHTALSGAGKFNLLIGDNGAGKTNLLEALSLLAPGRGLRRARLEEISRANGAGDFAVSASIQRVLANGQMQEMRIGTGTAPDRPGRRRVRIDGSDASALALGEQLAVFWLTPSMDGLFTDAAGVRRRFVDRMALALDPNHARHSSRYESLLRERNRVLSAPTQPDPVWLEGIEKQLAQEGTALAQGRLALIRQLADALDRLPDGPFPRPDLAYRMGGPLGEAKLRTALADGRQEDRRAGRTLTGPHRDDLEVTMESKGIAAALASTGEQKAMLVAITLAHAELAAASRPAILLLDEVAAHLDAVRRAALFDRLREGRAQIWLTGTEAAPFTAIADEAATWRISAGAAQRLG
jgi:DNA replication and repair protein RecF